MAAPTRVYVAVFVFSLIATLTVFAFTTVILSGYTPPQDFPLEAPDEYALGEKVAFVAGSLFCVALTGMSWRALVDGARVQQQAQVERAELQNAVEVGGTGVADNARVEDDEETVGYN